MGEDGQQIAPGSLSGEGGAQPSQELDGALSEAQGGGTQGGKGALVFAGEFHLLGDAFGATFEFGLGADALLPGEQDLESEKELMGEAEEARLHGLGCCRGGPGFGFSELIFQLVENLFDIPAAAGQFGKDPWR